MATTINPSGQTITQYNIQTGGASNLLNNVAPSATSGVPIISQGASSQPVFGTASVAGGGTGQTTLTNHGVLVGAATAAITQLAAGSAGQVLQSGGASADPAYSTATYPSTAGTSGKILISDGTNIVSSTPTYPNTSGTAGKVVISDGTNNVYSTPTFPNASATSGKIIKSDGTNWTASTETYAAPGTSGNIMTSDGTNWTSAAASGGSVLTATVTLTSAQIKALHATPIQVVAAPGSGKAIVVLYGYLGKFTYGGSNVFVAGASQVIKLIYGTTQSIGTVLSNALLVGSASVYNNSNLVPISGVSLATCDNVALNLYNDVATEISGNAANNNTFGIQIGYIITSI